MKKPLLFLLISIFLISFVSAWDYDYTYSIGDAYAYAKATGMYPACDGDVYGSYCAGKWYVDVSHIGDKFYIAYSVSEYPSADETGYISQGVQLTQDGRKYLDENGNVPRYVLCAWDYDSAPNGDWAWTGICGGYVGTTYLDSKKNVECYDNSDCFSGQICDKTGDWQTWDCKVDLCAYVSCEDKCEYATRYYDGGCLEGVCQYQTENCFYGCDGKLCAEETDDEIINGNGDEEELTLWEQFLNWVIPDKFINYIKGIWQKIFG